jgi:hypothetical protein
VNVAYSPDRFYKDIADTRQLFVDDDVVAFVHNVTRTQHSPVKHHENPLIRRDKPWEVVPYFRCPTFNVIRDPQDGVFKCWYEDYYDYFGYSPSEGIQGNRVYFAHSEDGIHWTKPGLGKFSIDGNDTNTVFSYPPYEMASCNSVLLDPKETDLKRRFKTVYYYRAIDANIPKRHPGGRHAGGLGIAFSPDGVDWTPYEGNPLIPEWMGDVEILTFDEIDDKYVLYGRHRGSPGGPISPGKADGVWSTRRRIYRSESKDLYEWTDPQLILDPGSGDNLDDGLYGFVPWRVGEMHFGLLNVLHLVENTMEMYLLHSRDGLNWERLLHHRPFIPRGGDDSYDRFGAETPTQPLVVGDELWFYYGGMKVHHDWWIWGVNEGIDVPETRDSGLARDGHHLCLATMRIDGYVSLDATVREGWIETKPVFSPGAHLFINGKCNEGGYIDVEIVHNAGGTVEEFSRDRCERFTGDSVRHRVKWSAGDTLSEIPGAVKLKFYLKNAELYGFQFNDGP